MIVHAHRTEKQQYIIDEAFSGEWDVILVSAGLAFGKTYLTGDMGITYSAMYPATNNAIAGPVFDQLSNSNLLEFNRLLNERKIRANWNNRANTLELSNDTRWKAQTMEVPHGRLKGPEYQCGLIDEASHIPRNKFERFRDRVGRNARIDAPPVVVAFCNSVPKGHWLYQDFVAEPLPRHKLIQGTTYDNARNLQPAYIGKLESRYPAGSIARRAWMYGEVGLPLEGAVLPEFDAGRDIVPANKAPKTGQYAVVMFMGEGPRPTVALKVGVSDDVLVVVDEFRADMLPPSKIVEGVLALCPRGSSQRILAANWPEEMANDFRKRGLNLVEPRVDLRSDENLDVANQTMRERLVNDKLKVVGTSGKLNECAAPYLVENFETWEYPEDSEGLLKHRYLPRNNEGLLCMLALVMQLDRPNARHDFKKVMEEMRLPLHYKGAERRGL